MKKPTPYERVMVGAAFVLGGPDAQPTNEIDAELHHSGRCTCHGDGHCMWCQDTSARTHREELARALEESHGLDPDGPEVRQLLELWSGLSRFAQQLGLDELGVVAEDVADRLQHTIHPPPS